MKNLGIFFPVSIRIDELTNLGLELGGLQIGESTLRFGEIADEAYLDLVTDLSNGCFDDEEFEELRNQLGFAPVSYVSIHLNYSQRAYARALQLARIIQERWNGSIDYSGVTGDVRNPFVAPPARRQR